MTHKHFWETYLRIKNKDGTFNRPELTDFQLKVLEEMEMQLKHGCGQVIIKPRSVHLNITNQALIDKIEAAYKEWNKNKKD